MRRRQTLVLAALALPGAARARLRGRPARIGWLATYPLAQWAHREVFAKAMREHGYTEGSDYVIDLLAYEGRIERLPALAAELVRRAPDVIVASATPTVAPLMQATRTIPIVFVGVADPVGSGLVTSMNRPGGNVTGLGGLGERLFAKNIEWLSQALPRARRLGLAHNPDIPLHAAYMPEMDAAAQQLGVQLHKVPLRAPDDLARALAALAHARVEGVFLVGQPWHANQAARVAALCLEHRLPAIGLSAELSQAGLLMSYGWKGEDQAHRLAYYLDRILKGAAPGELPVEQPTRLYLRLNLKTARALGLELPPALLLRADEVIE